MRKVIQAWMAPEDQGAHPSMALSPSVTLVLQSAKFFGYCPVDLLDISDSYFVVFWCLLLIASHFIIVFDILRFLLGSSKNVWLGFTTLNDVSTILYLTLVVQAFANQVSSIYNTSRWKDLVHGLRSVSHTVHVNQTNYSCGTDFARKKFGGLCNSKALHVQRYVKI
jgi:hypothetical protein